MISLSDLTMRFGTQVLFENVAWRLNPGGHYGLVGANGTGKSTLLHLLSGELKPESGQISRANDLRLGILEQDHFRNDALRLLDVVLMGRPRLWEALREKHVLIEKAGNGGELRLDEAEGRRLGELETMIADSDGYTAEAYAASMLAGLGLPEERHDRPMGELSGGYRLRVLLARTLFQEPQLLLLDEPTNHLDIVSIRWLEGHLRTFPGTFVLVSHDRHFLNTVCDHIADLDYLELRLYPGNYDRFATNKAMAEERKKKEIARTEKKVAEMQQFIDRFRAKATKARQAQSRQKQVERMELPQIKRSSRQYPVFKFTPKRPSGREALTLRQVAKGFDGSPVLEGVSLELARGDKLAVVGPNGIGKSTLLKLIVGELQTDRGSVELGYELQLGYFAQEHQAVLNARGTVYDWLYMASPDKEIGTVRGTLGRVLFSGDEAAKPLAALSGGEATRLRLAELMLRGDNLLVLDEPTNHLDLEGREALMQALLDYQGSLIFVSHDQHFVSTVATRVLALSPDGQDDHHGTYEEYLARQGADYLNADSAVLAVRKSTRKNDREGGEEFERRKARKRDVARLRKQIGKLEAEVAALEKEVREIDRRFAEKDYYGKTSWEQIESDERGKQELKRKLESTMAAWENAAGDLEREGEGS
ncbi:MAG: ATP-binding cassette domain-containing protein [SAR324 cluster bacterium]|nr:ATP-binding cassette domain-containing protein [SAR324 cluster bacterium]